jgi:hypothetical protein
MLKMRDPGRHLSENEIASFEARLGRLLPMDYRQFIATNNGGISDDYRIMYFNRFYEQMQTLIVFEWLPLLAEDSHTSERLTIEVARKNLDRLCPESMIPIALSISTEPVLIALNNDNRGFIYFLDTGVPDQRSISLVSKSFSEFINSLQPYA